MASLLIGTIKKPVSILRFPIVPQSSSFATGAQASEFRIATMRFQRSSCNHNLEGFHHERIVLHQRCNAKFVSKAASPNHDQLDGIHHSMTPIETVLRGMDILYRFTRPYAAIGTVLSVCSMSLLAVEHLSDFTPMFFIKVFQAVVGALLMQIYVCGFNQICDIELDKVNKPFLPLAAGELSMSAAIIVSSLSALMSLSIAWISRSWPLFWALFAWLLVGTAYSANVLPLLRWKRFPFTAALYMLNARAVTVPMAYYMHAQSSIRGGSFAISTRNIFAMGILSLFSVATIFFKDIPDIEGDRMHGIQSLASRIGPKMMFWICVCLLEIAYGAAMLVGASSSFPWSKYVTIFGHLVMASMLWVRAKSVDLKSMVAIQSMYMFLWQLFYAEYFLIPLVR